MKQVKGFFLPDDEEHLVPYLESGPEFASGPTYQLHKLMAAMPYVKNFRHAVDVGGHCGLWTRPLAAMFRHVTAFEPVERHRECWRANITTDNAELKQYALGNHEGKVRLHTGPSSSGDTYISADGEHVAEIRTLDSFGLADVDLIKIDCEGAEKFVIEGGSQTIRKYRPVMIVEQKPNKGSQFGIDDLAALAVLGSWGAKIHKVISGDYILGW